MLGVQNVPQQDTDKYGIVTLERNPSRRASARCPTSSRSRSPTRRRPRSPWSGATCLSPSIFDDLAKIGKGAGGEIQLTDGIARLMQREPVYAFEFEGKRYDCGNKLGYLQATVEFGLKHPSLGSDFAAYLKELASRL